MIPRAILETCVDYVVSPPVVHEPMSAEEATEAVAALESAMAKRAAADRIVAMLMKHLDGRRLAAERKSEVEQAAQRDREHFVRMMAIAACEACQANYDGAVCEEHDINKDYL
jgi:hypothetical protein